MRYAVRDGLGVYSQLKLVSILLFISNALTSSLEPISVPFGSDFIGYDGQWSPAQIRVGNPQQYLSLLPSTTESEAWVVGPAGCDGTSTCSTLRGGLFSSSQSETWQALGAYELGYSSLSQATDNGYYGIETLSFSDAFSVPDQIIAVVNDTSHWIGQLGLGVQKTRFQNNTDYLPFLSSLVQNESMIPSHSYGYTAGAFYKGKSVSGSLTLGGVDTSRFVANDLWFSLGEGYLPSIAVNSLEVFASNRPQYWRANPLRLLSSDQAAVFTIDSNTPFLWFPENVCDHIARVFNLTWNESAQIYTFAEGSSPQTLQDLDLQFTFQLGNSVDSSQNLALNISYDAFNLQLSYPFPGLFESYTREKVNYFPMRRTNNSNQYTIGRSFLQETYLTVDYERNVFALSQALFPDSSQPALLSAIARPKNSTWPGPQNGRSGAEISLGGKIGIAAGMLVVIVAAVMLIWHCTKKRRQLEQLEDDERRPETGLFSVRSRRSARENPAPITTAELYADKRHPAEMVSDSSTSRYELSAISPIEMAAADVSPAFFETRVHTHITQRNDPRSPIELAYKRRQTPSAKENIKHAVEQLDIPAPAYSPLDSEQRSNSISPFTPVGSHPFRGDSDQAISPIKSSSNSRSELDSRLQP